MSEAVDPESQAKLEEQLARLTALIDGYDDDSDDAIARARLARLRVRSAMVLAGLKRRGESLDALERAIAFYRSATLDETDDLWFWRALGYRHGLLDNLGRAPRLEELDAEIILRFRHSEAAEPRADVARALANRSRRLLADPASFDQGVEVNTELINLLTREPEETVLAVAEVCLKHMEALTHRNGPLLEAVLTFVAQAGIANGLAAGRAVGRRLPVPFERLSLPRPLAARLSHPALVNLAGRAREARRVEGALLSRLYSLDTAQARKLAARAQFAGMTALMLLGNTAGSYRTMEQMAGHHDPDAAAALDDVLERFDLSSTAGQLQAIGFLSQRARALGDGDGAAARAAYEESLDARFGPDRAWIVRLWARALRPSIPRSARGSGTPG